VTTTEAVPSPVEADQIELAAVDAEVAPPSRSHLRIPRRLAVGNPVTGRGTSRVLRNLAIVAVVGVLFAGSLVDIADFLGLKQPAASVEAPTQVSAGDSQSLPVLSEVRLTASDAKLGAERSYTVLRGDYLYDIARRHGTTPQVLAELNGIRDLNRIEVGQVILLPATTDD